MTIWFGVTVVQLVPYPNLLDNFLYAESIGLDSAWVLDQFWIDEAREISLTRGPGNAGGGGARTRRIGFGSMVTNVADLSTPPSSRSRYVGA